MNTLLILDEKILWFISVRIKNKYFNKFMPVITYFNDYGKIYILLVFILLLNSSSMILGYTVLASLMLGCILGEGIFKLLIKRSRPVVDINDCKALICKPRSYSFPSGHTTSSFAVFSVLWCSNFKYKDIFLVLAVLISFSRIYLNVHYPSDVAGGIILGILCGKYTVFIFRNLIDTRFLSSNDSIKDIILYSIFFWAMIMIVLKVLIRSRHTEFSPIEVKEQEN